ncbi:MAG: glycosyltransferase family 2 protein [Chloroflexi bacterium]|nr:glycosyltransferase family 2 protein [Chloroflexota bacterium]MCC6891656.1 glycosyltransferase family 2 protein [Anaerolineae bacterium]
MQGTSIISPSSYEKVFAYDRPGTQNLFNVHVTDFPRVSIVIPTLNEAKNLRYVLPYIPDWVHEVLIVDGHSKDNTREVALSMRPDVKIVEETRRGKGVALAAGFHAAEGDIIVMMDADGSMNPAEIALYVGALRSGADYVKGSRFLQGGGTSDMTFIRKMGNLGLTWAVRILFGGQYTDLCYGYNAFWKRALYVMDPNCDGFEIETLMNIRALRSNLKVAEVPSYESDRVHGESNLKPIRDGLRVLRTIISERISSPKNRIAEHWTWQAEKPTGY